jgi:hypothetical protein
MSQTLSFKIMFLLMFPLMNILFSCDDDSTWTYSNTVEMGNGVFVEVFVKQYGVHGGDSRKHFLTDSSSFRIPIGVCDDKEYFNVDIQDNVAIVNKYTRRNLKGNNVSLISSETFELPK